MTRAEFIEPQDISQLEDVLVGGTGLLAPVPHVELERFNQGQVSQFCVKHACYQIPTQELIDWLADKINGRKVLEIGAGNGCIGRALGIQMVDNYMQTWPEIKSFYDAVKQPTISYGGDVEEMDALEAIGKYEPEVVIGAWITQKFKEGMNHGNENGVDEVAFINHVKEYILIGNENTHGDKALFDYRKPEKLSFPWLVSRSTTYDDNRIYIVNG